MTLRFLIPSVAFMLGAACASSGTTPSPKAESCSAAIRAAEEVGATHTPTAALHLQLAKEQFEHARLLSEKDKYGADRLRMRAQVDAELALALARSESEKGEARDAIEKMKTLQESTSK